VLKIVDSLPQPKSALPGTMKSAVECDLLMFINSGERYCQITLRETKDHGNGVTERRELKGERVASRCKGWLRRRNISHITVRVINGTCYCVNENACRDWDKRRAAEQPDAIGQAVAAEPEGFRRPPAPRRRAKKAAGASDATVLQMATA
jgi:hypothetical protein